MNQLMIGPGHSEYKNKHVVVVVREGWVEMQYLFPVLIHLKPRFVISQVVTGLWQVGWSKGRTRREDADEARQEA